MVACRKFWHPGDPQLGGCPFCCFCHNHGHPYPRRSPEHPHLNPVSGGVGGLGGDSPPHLLPGICPCPLPRAVTGPTRPGPPGPLVPSIARMVGSGAAAGRILGWGRGGLCPVQAPPPQQAPPPRAGAGRASEAPPEHIRARCPRGQMHSAPQQDTLSEEAETTGGCTSSQDRSCHRMDYFKETTGRTENWVARLWGDASRGSRRGHYGKLRWSRSAHTVGAHDIVLLFARKTTSHEEDGVGFAQRLQRAGLQEGGGG